MEELGKMWPLIITAIQDEVDDVRAVTATCLLPVVDKLPSVIPEKVSLISFNIEHNLYIINSNS